MNPEVEARWTALRDAITRDVGDGWELGDDEPHLGGGEGDPPCVVESEQRLLVAQSCRTGCWTRWSHVRNHAFHAESR
jgi:hypothetical protein